MMDGPFRKPTFTHQPPLNLFERVGSNYGGNLYPGDPGFEDRSNPLFRKFYNRHRGNFGGYFVVLFFALFLLGWCCMLWNSDGTMDWNGCPDGSQRVHGWSNGSYTNLCIDPVRR